MVVDRKETQKRRQKGKGYLKHRPEGKSGKLEKQHYQCGIVRHAKWAKRLNSLKAVEQNPPQNAKSKEVSRAWTIGGGEELYKEKKRVKKAGNCQDPVCCVWLLWGWWVGFFGGCGLGVLGVWVCVFFVFGGGGGLGLFLGGRGVWFWVFFVGFWVFFGGGFGVFLVCGVWVWVVLFGGGVWVFVFFDRPCRPHGLVPESPFGQA